MQELLHFHSNKLHNSHIDIKMQVLTGRSVKQERRRGMIKETEV
ncbi:hypothetical protein [Marinilabilia salmonicolor]|nr:hypothetical protein [Marinilabilia salmonicolor]